MGCDDTKCPLEGDVEDGNQDQPSRRPVGEKLTMKPTAALDASVLPSPFLSCRPTPSCLNRYCRSRPRLPFFVV
ncbi:hypothetical protein SKAU_G00428870 [Synaphobranchus kaupii]|uniref:Uncharacterized protein n=1 Tax=Synaphobranchus kaupii TaxID=118154 RepID=A0A9Q1E4J4_SYNKA|nr:hypothetical protein SKAU_G00428870 [Synaphobranchus kaupii]